MIGISVREEWVQLMTVGRGIIIYYSRIGMMGITYSLIGEELMGKQRDWCWITRLNNNGNRGNCQHLEGSWMEAKYLFDIIGLGDKERRNQDKRISWSQCVGAIIALVPMDKLGEKYTIIAENL